MAFIAKNLGTNNFVNIFLIISVFQTFQLSQCQYYLSTTPCGTLYTEENFGGQNISLLDQDQSISLHDDQRSATGTWPETKSVHIQNSCSMEICNETYFDGECHKLTNGEHPVLNLNMTDIASARCSCEKECSCADIFMKKSSCARAYLEGGCRSCNALYIDLDLTTGLPDRQRPKLFPEEFKDRVSALKLRKGCTLTIFSGEESDESEAREERIVDSETLEDFKGEIGSYECECDDSKFIPKVKPPRPESYPPLIDVPTTMDDVIKMLMNEKYSNHPGLRAAHQSLKAGRSSKNAYILLIGSTGSGKSSAINLLFDNPNVTKVGGEKSTTTDIHEFRIPVPIDELGVANSELRVIDTPGLGDTRGLSHDAMFLATLDDYLTSHEELKDRIPNIVLVFHKFHDNRFNGKGSAFVQMLRGLDSFRTRITDESYSNVIFVLSHFCSETKKVKRRPEIRLAQFKDVIEDFSQFPRPTLITVAENRPKDNELPMVNGYARLPNNEYYPRNLFEKLELVTEKGGDPIGLGVYRTAFRDSDDFNITSVTFKLLPNKNEKVTFYLGILTNALIGVINTEISKLLKHVWEEKVDAELKRKFPESLPYLQKALNMKNIHTEDDIPKTATAILELLTSIKHDEATRMLIEKALGIKAPVFPSDTIAGHSYNVFKDTYLTTSPFVLGDLKQSDIGFMIPKSLSVKLEPGNKEHFQVFEDKQEYIQYRLQNLGIAGTLSEANFTGIYKPGHNIKSVAFRNDSCSLSATREVRLFEFQLNDRLDLTDEFKHAVTSLPAFNESDYEIVDIWTKFFNDYGTHVVHTIYGGGAIEIELKSDKPYDSRISQALFDLIKFAEEMSFLIIRDGDSSGNETSSRGVIDKGINHSLKFIGGDAAYHTTDLTKMSMENAAKLLTNWKKSLKYHPSVLTTEMRLVPIGQIVKKLGQNYSSEIERATSLLFNSTLKYVPPKKRATNQGPGLARDQTPVLDGFMQQMAANNAIMQQLMGDMMKMEAERQKRQEEMEQKRLEFEMEQKRKDREFQEASLKAREKNEEERRAFERELEETRRKDQLEREQRQAKYQQEMMVMQAEISRRNNELIQQIANRPPHVIEKPGGGCLKAGTKILMADGSEKKVEELQIGDLLLDMDLKPTRLLGVNYQYLLDLEFHGFDDQSYFFTGEHMFIGPKNNSEDPTNNIQFYVNSRPSLLANNPLMIYWDVKEMGESNDLRMFHYESESKTVKAKHVGVFKDSQVHSPNEPMYFIQVDNPSGTYFANGYVCKVDVPPVERWPNTMSLLFNLMRAPVSEKLMERKYCFDTIFFIESLTINLTQTVDDFMRNAKWNKVDLNGSLMTLENAEIDKSLHKIFNDPTSALFSIKIYASLAPVLHSRLDPIEGPNDVQHVAKMQHILYELILSELNTYANMN